MRERDHLEGQGVDGRILKWIFKKCYGSINRIGVAKWGSMAGCCKCGNESSCSIKCEKLPEYLLASQEELCSAELVFNSR